MNSFRTKDSVGGRGYVGDGPGVDLVDRVQLEDMMEKEEVDRAGYLGDGREADHERVILTENLEP